MNDLLKRTWLLTGGIFAFALIVYGLSAVLRGQTQTPTTAYFPDLADAFLHKRLYLAAPQSQIDLTLYRGRWYVPFPPLPALLMLPWVAVRGVARVNTVWFGVIVGAANVALAWLLLHALAQRGWTHLRRVDNLWLTLVLAMGSVHWYMTLQGSVWFVSQMCTLMFLLLSAWLAVSTASPLLSGAALAVAMLARPNVALGYVLLLGIGVQHAATQQRPFNARVGLRWALLALMPVAISGTLLLGYNAARFNNPFDFGYLSQNVNPSLAADLHTYGQFNIRYVPHNLWSMLLTGPVWDAQRNQFVPTVDGLSLLLTTPALVLLVKSRQRSALVVGAWLALGLLLVPLITYYNTGWWQFGYRFSLDFMTPVLILLAIGAGERVGWTLRVLMLLGVIVNAWGVWWFANPRFTPFGP